jgi:hypothetical protein
MLPYFQHWRATDELNNLCGIKYGLIEEGQMGIDAGHELPIFFL